MTWDSGPRTRHKAKDFRYQGQALLCTVQMRLKTESLQLLVLKGGNALLFSLTLTMIKTLTYW